MKRLIGTSLIVVLLFAPLSYGGEKVDVNTATEAELVKLPGIGSVIAKRLIEYREVHEGFKSVEELMKVKGIGKKRLEKLRGLVTIGETK